MSRFLKRLYLAAVIPYALNLPDTIFLLTGIITRNKLDYDFLELVVWLAVAFFLCAGTYLWILAGPVYDGKQTGFRVRMMMGGRRSILCGFYGAVVQIFIICFSFPACGQNLFTMVTSAAAVARPPLSSPAPSQGLPRSYLLPA